MKVKKEAATLQSKPGIQPRNSLLNFFIVILFIIICFLGYNLLKRINLLVDKNDDETLFQDTTRIQVEVLNGCGVPGIADQFTDLLRTKKFDVVSTGNYRTFNIDDSIIIDRNGNIKHAKLLAEAIGIDKKHVIEQENKDYFLDVTLIIGKDYKQFLQNN